MAEANASASDEERRAARSAGLLYVRDSDPGLRRRRSGRGFAYVAPDGHTVRDAETLTRIRTLAIPPAYVDVWIAMEPRAHLQATGRDARGRKQYRYHPQWRRVRDRDKYATMADFAAALPRLRRQLARDLALPGLPRERVLAAVVLLLVDTGLRIGNREYARSNGSFGLTTLCSRHVDLKRGQPRLRFRAKGGLLRECDVTDPRVVRLIRRCHPLPGQALFQYCVDDGMTFEPIDSTMVNDYLRTCMQGDYTAKDFRTWRATRAALETLARTPLPASERACKAIESEVVRSIARELGNTPAVARSSYIDPLVFEAWRAGTLGRSYAAVAPRSPGQCERWAERTLRRLKRARR